ncbi:sugar transferase [Candidatus Binatus sp.]|uniref:sugar transferase n=1 Tax=Candidatus Binatus sp. TaxID=2811406 RepID=UPI002F93ED8E
MAERIADAICIFVGYLLATEIALAMHWGRIQVFPPGGASEAQSQYSSLLIFAILSWLTLTAYTETYQAHRTERLNFLARRLIQTLVVWSLVTIAAIFVLKFEFLSRQFTGYFITASMFLIFVRQLGTVLVLRSLRRSAHKWRTAVVIGGDEATCEHFAQLLTAAHPMGYQRVDVQPGKRAVDCNGNRVESDRDFKSASLEAIDDVYLIGVNDGGDGPASAGRMLSLLKQGKSVHIIPSLLDTRLFRQSLGDIAGIPVLSVSKGELSPVQAAVKRAVDFVVSALLLIVLSPVIAAIAVAVKLTSWGPALFRQKRLGLDGKPFTLFKFRTMRADAEQILKDSPSLYAKYLGNNFKLPNGEDPRLAPLGRFLRATSLDELPQLFNVLIGEMSLVGPRPIVPHEAVQYGDSAMLFMSAKPGMTGHWQVSGRSEIAEYRKRVELDLEYIRDQSFGKDLEILLRTVPAVLRRKGAN